MLEGVEDFGELESEEALCAEAFDALLSWEVCEFFGALFPELFEVCVCGVEVLGEVCEVLAVGGGLVYSEVLELFVDEFLDCLGLGGVAPWGEVSCEVEDLFGVLDAGLGGGLGG